MYTKQINLLGNVQPSVRMGLLEDAERSGDEQAFSASSLHRTGVVAEQERVVLLRQPDRLALARAGPKEIRLTNRGDHLGPWRLRGHPHSNGFGRLENGELPYHGGWNEDATEETRKEDGTVDLDQVPEGAIVSDDDHSPPERATISRRSA